MKRYEAAPGRYVPTDINGEPTLCLCKPWQLCTSCGLYEHAGGFCSWCGSKTTLQVLAARPFFRRDAVRTAKAARRAGTARLTAQGAA